MEKLGFIIIFARFYIFLTQFMSSFREIKETHLLDAAEPLMTNGSTCLCYKVKVYDRWQFVKRLRPELEKDLRYVNLFRKEFAVGSKLSHPNLISYNELETSDEGLIILQDFVEGRTLAHILKDEPGYFKHHGRTEKFARQMFSVLDYLHSHQVLHLDLKPDNVMITRVNEDVKVLDLGFCRTDSFTSSEGMTEGFDAPEQKSGDVADARTDLYAVGRLLEEIEKAQGEKLPSTCHELMLRCLKKKPEDRPQHAADCLKVLQAERRTWWKVVVGVAVLSVLTGFFLFYQLQHKAEWNDHCCHLRVLSEQELTCEVTGWDNAEGANMMVPATSVYRGKEYRVVAITDTAMVHCQDVETVFLPEGLERIGERSFNHCEMIETLNLPNSLTQWGDGCFACCYGLKNLRLPDSLQVLPPRAFHACTSLTHVEIPEGVTRIGTDCFVADSALVSVSLPSKLEILDRGVFFLCRQLTEITLPAKLKSIGDYAFYGCDNLTQITCLALDPPSVLECFQKKEIVLRVPSESIEKYRNHPVWGQMRVENL